jgi:hypothetical protein
MKYPFFIYIMLSDVVLFLHAVYCYLGHNFLLLCTISISIQQDSCCFLTLYTAFPVAKVWMQLSSVQPHVAISPFFNAVEFWVLTRTKMPPLSLRFGHRDKLDLKAVKDGSASYAALEKKVELYETEQSDCSSYMCIHTRSVKPSILHSQVIAL